MALRQGEYKAAQIGIIYYNSHVRPEEKQLDLAKRIDNLLLNNGSSVDRALSIVTEKLNIPEVPKTLYEMTFQLQLLKDQELLVQRYLLVKELRLNCTQSITPEHIGVMLKDSVTEAEPYELIIQSFAKILRCLYGHGLTQKERFSLLLGDRLSARSPY